MGLLSDIFLSLMDTSIKKTTGKGKEDRINDTVEEIQKILKDAEAYAEEQREIEKREPVGYDKDGKPIYWKQHDYSKLSKESEEFFDKLEAKQKKRIADEEKELKKDLEEFKTKLKKETKKNNLIKK